RFSLSFRPRKFARNPNRPVAQKLKENLALGFRYDDLKDCGRIQIKELVIHRRSWRSSSSVLDARVDGRPDGGPNLSRSPCGGFNRPCLIRRSTGDSSSRSGTKAATVRPRSVTRNFSPAATRRRYTLKFCRSSRTPTLSDLFM